MVEGGTQTRVKESLPCFCLLRVGGANRSRKRGDEEGTGDDNDLHAHTRQHTNTHARKWKGAHTTRIERQARQKRHSVRGRMPTHASTSKTQTAKRAMSGGCRVEQL